MTDTSVAPSTAQAEPSLVSRFIGVITSPRETFASVVRQPRWLGMLILTTVVAAACTAGLMMTEVGQTAALDQQVSTLESFGVTVTEEMYQQFQDGAKMLPYTSALPLLVAIPIVQLVMAGILLGVFNAALGGDASFKQVFAIVSHAGAITVLQQLFVAPLNYQRESMSSPTNLSVFLPMLEEGSFLARMFGVIDLFIIWWVLVLAIGLAVLYRRKTTSIFLSLSGVYLAIAVAIAAVMSRLGG